MALRARLTPLPTPVPEVWPWHTVKSKSLPVSLLGRNDRRMEAETFLASGYGIRVNIESKSSGWTSLDKLCLITQPNRMKAILVNPGDGVPFLAPTQVFDQRPIPRKFLALDKMPGSKACFVEHGTILVTRSGNVGRAIVSYAPHVDLVVSDDLLRVSAINSKHTGWIYAYLRSEQARAMATAANYGHIIRHLECSHLGGLPIPEVDDATAATFKKRVQRIVKLRDKAHALTLEAEARFTESVGPLPLKDAGQSGFAVRSSAAFSTGRRRLEAAAHHRDVANIRKHLDKCGKGFTALRDAGFNIWVPGRYKRIPAETGVVYRDSQDLMQVNPDLKKRFADCKFGDKHRGRVRDGWLLIPSSGQVYGIIGTPIIATKALDNQVVSNHVVRIAPQKDALLRIGYVMVALSHPVFGRPQVKAMPFGSSVPELAVDDLADFEVVRLGDAEESAIANLAERSAAARAEADALEQQIADEAGQIIEKFIQS